MSGHSHSPAADATGPSPSQIAAEIIRQTTMCGSDRSICPSDVARALAPEWRRLLAPVRHAAIVLAEAGRIDILRKGKAIPPRELRGVIRLRLRPGATPDGDG
jgi:hypothetical protein